MTTVINETWVSVPDHWLTITCVTAAPVQARHARVSASVIIVMVRRSIHGDSKDRENLAQRQTHSLGQRPDSRDVARCTLRLFRLRGRPLLRPAQRPRDLSRQRTHAAAAGFGEDLSH